MLTKPRQYPFPAPAGEYSVTCDYCGCEWYRSDCIRNADGMLACPDDQEGRTTAELNRLEQQAVAEATSQVTGVRREPW